MLNYSKFDSIIIGCEINCQTCGSNFHTECMSVENVNLHNAGKTCMWSLYTLSPLLRSLLDQPTISERKTLQKLRRKNFRTAPYFIMHAVLINNAFDSLSLNTIDNSLSNWIYTSLITTYCINKSGFFSQRFFPRCFSLSLSPFSPLSLPHFSGGHFLLSILPPSPLSGYFFFFFYVTCRIPTLNSLSSSSDQQSILYTLVLHVLVANNG